MLALPHVEDMVARVTEILRVGPEQLSVSVSQFSLARVMQELNSAYGVLTTQAIAAERRELLERSTVTVNQETRQLGFNADPARAHILAVTDPSVGEGETLDELMASVSPMRGSLRRMKQVPFRFVGSSLYLLEGGPASVSVWYFRVPPPLVQTTVVSAPSAATLRLTTTAAHGSLDLTTNTYAGSVFRVGTTPPVTARAASSLYTSPNFDVGFVSHDGTSTPFSGLTISAAQKVSVIPWFPEVYTDALCYLAATQFRHVDAATQAGGAAAARLTAFSEYLRKTDRFTPKKVYNTGNAKSGIPGNGI